MQQLSEQPFGAGGLTTRLYRLDNGLKVILLRDSSAPLFSYQTWFGVGSRHEHEGKTGIAHLFEHLMFNQTEHLAPGEFDRRIEAAGGDSNAATWVDWTYYRVSLPRSSLALAVELEADRMAHLTLGSEQVESEREVVMNERRYRVEDDVDGFLGEELYRIAYKSHPYRWPTIGWMRDIEALTIDDCRRFYRTYYAPNNATLVLVGDVDEAAALATIEAAYGPLPMHELPVEAPHIEPEQKGERRALFAKPTLTDKLRIGYKAPPLGHPDYARLEVASEILFGGNSSRLYRRLVIEGELASSVYATPAPVRDTGLFEIGVALQRHQRAAAAEKVIYEELERLASTPLDARELETAKTRLMTHFWTELRPQAGKAEALGQFAITAGDHRKLFDVAEAYAQVGANDVAEVVASYLVPSSRTVVIAEPAAGAEAA